MLDSRDMFELDVHFSVSGGVCNVGEVGLDVFPVGVPVCKVESEEVSRCDGNVWC